MNLAKKSKSGYIILVEGNIDVVSLHQAGFDNAVASLGTSLTPEQARLISRFKNEVVIAYDADEAGRKASQRAISILEKLELKVRVLTVSGAKDPDEFIKARGAEAFRNLLSDSDNHIEYKLEQVRAGCDLGTAEGKVSYLKGAAEVIAALPDPASREVYSLKTAEVCGVRPGGGAGRGQAGTAAQAGDREKPGAEGEHAADEPVSAPGAEHQVQGPALCGCGGGRHQAALSRPGGVQRR